MSKSECDMEGSGNGCFTWSQFVKWVVNVLFLSKLCLRNWDFFVMPCLLPLPLIFLPTPKVIHFLLFSSAIIVINQSQVTAHTKTKKSRKVKWRVSALPYYYYHCVLSFLPSRASYKLSYTVQLITWLSRIWKAKLLLGFLKIDIF